MAKAQAVSKATVQRIWRARGLQPHRVETPAHSDKELAEPNFKGFGNHRCWPTVTTRPRRWP